MDKTFEGRLKTTLKALFHQRITSFFYISSRIYIYINAIDFVSYLQYIKRIFKARRFIYKIYRLLFNILQKQIYLESFVIIIFDLFTYTK